MGWLSRLFAVKPAGRPDGIRLDNHEPYWELKGKADFPLLFRALHAPGFCKGRSLMQHVAHQHMVLLFRGPGGLGSFVGVDHGCVAFHCRADRLLLVLLMAYTFC